MHAFIGEHAPSAAIRVGGSHEKLYVTGFVGLGTARLTRSTRRREQPSEPDFEDKKAAG